MGDIMIFFLPHGHIYRNRIFSSVLNLKYCILQRPLLHAVIWVYFGGLISCALISAQDKGFSEIELSGQYVFCFPFLPSQV